MEKTYGAQFIWKIEHYSEKLQDARTNKKTTLFSPHFSTSRHGYRLALSICLCGDGKGKISKHLHPLNHLFLHLAKGKYISLFICICRGEYDALLVWPFSHRVTFTLLDQCDDVDNRRILSIVLNQMPAKRINISWSTNYRSKCKFLRSKNSLMLIR